MDPLIFGCLRGFSWGAERPQWPGLDLTGCTQIGSVMFSRWGPRLGSHPHATCPSCSVGTRIAILGNWVIRLGVELVDHLLLGFYDCLCGLGMFLPKKWRVVGLTRWQYRLENPQSAHELYLQNVAMHLPWPIPIWFLREVPEIIELPTFPTAWLKRWIGGMVPAANHEARDLKGGEAPLPVGAVPEASAWECLV